MSAFARVPKLLLAAILLNGLLMLWLWYHGQPRYHSDAVCFKQPAYMRLHTPWFSLPTLVGQPDTDRFFSYPSCAFTVANYLVFRVFGFSYSVSIGFDLAIHLALTTMVAVLLWKVTGRSGLAALSILCTLQILMPLGRPEEFALLLVTLALVAIEYWPNRTWIPILLLGATGVTSPGAAVVGTVLVVAYAWFRDFWPQHRIRRSVVTFAFAPVVSALMYAALNWPHLSDAVAQHWHLENAGFYSKASLSELLLSLPEIVVPPLVFAAVTVLTAIAGHFFRRDWFPRGTTAGAFVSAAAVAVLVGLALNIAMRRLAYDYRHIALIGSAATLIAMSWLPLTATWASRVRYAALIAGLCGLSLSPLVSLGRYTLAPLTWTTESVRFADAQRKLKDALRSDESIGGDGSLWAMVDDGRPYFATQHCFDTSKLPDVLVTSRWANPPSLLQKGDIADIIAKNYAEIELFPSTGENGTYLQLFGLKVPIARGSSDWSIRAWRKLPSQAKVQTE